MSVVEVTPADVRVAAYGLTIPVGTEIDNAIGRVIAKAQDRVEAAFPTIGDRVAAGTIPADRVKGVIEDMVIRVLRNPNAYRQVSIDDYSRMIDTAVSSGALYISPEERTLLTPKRRRPAVRSLRLGVPAWRQPRV